MANIREDMVKRAVVFLRHPKVKYAPRERQVAFLTDKSLTTEVSEDIHLYLVSMYDIICVTTHQIRPQTWV